MNLTIEVICRQVTALMRNEPSVVYALVLAAKDGTNVVRSDAGDDTQVVALLERGIEVMESPASTPFDLTTN